MAGKTIPYRDISEAAIIVNTLFIEGKLVVGANGVLEATPKLKELLDKSNHADAKTVLTTLDRGVEIAKKNGIAKGETTPEREVGPKFDFEVCLATLHKAQQGGLDALTEDEKKLVAVQPAERQARVRVKTKDGFESQLAFDANEKPVMEPNPLAGKIGYSKPVYDSMTGTVNAYERKLKNRDQLKVGDVTKMEQILGSAKEAIAAGKASLGIEVAAPEKAKEADLEPSQG